SVVEILLPDMAELRVYGPLLVLEARVAIAERRYADTVHTLETGFSFSRQMSEQPFLIGDLVGISIANQLLDTLADLLEQPASPNLYWSLTALPRPLIELRGGLDFEYTFPEMQFPDLDDLDRPRTAQEWDSALARVRKEWARIVGFDKEVAPKDPPPPGTAA